MSLATNFHQRAKGPFYDILIVSHDLRIEPTDDFSSEAKPPTSTRLYRHSTTPTLLFSMEDKAPPEAGEEHTSAESVDGGTHTQGKMT